MSVGRNMDSKGGCSPTGSASTGPAAQRGRTTASGLRRPSSSGECVLVIEDEECLKAWDFVHVAVDEALHRRGDGPCVIVMAGSRAAAFRSSTRLNDVAAKHGARARGDVDPDQAYADFGLEELVADPRGLAAVTVNEGTPARAFSSSTPAHVSLG